MELKLRGPLTPNEPIEHITSSIDPRIGDFTELSPVPYLSISALAEMPMSSCLRTEMTMEAMHEMRRSLVNGSLGAEFCFEITGARGGTCLIKIYKMPLGEYYSRAQAEYMLQLDQMEKGKLHYFTFTNNDTLYLFRDIVKMWEKLRGEAIQIGPTYDGMNLTWQVRRLTDEMMGPKTRDKVMRIRERIQREQESTADEKPRESVSDRRAKARPKTFEEKPYHGLDVDQAVTLSEDQYTTSQALRTIVYRYAKRNHQKLSVRANDDNTVTITRTA